MRAGSWLIISVMIISCAGAGGDGATRGRAPSGGGHGGGSPPALIATAALGAVTLKKWRLENGLELVFAGDPSATSVSYMTWFRVGSRNENAAAHETGLAHLFEHLMFTQTKGAREPGAFDRKLEEVGGNINAMTSYDFTAYVDNMPPDALPLAIALEADRMVNLALEPQQVETEREVVAEERLSAIEDSVDGLLDEVMHAQAFKRHPYRFPVIGLMKDIKAVTPAMAIRFYRTFYAPNNAVVVVAGRFDEQTTLNEIVARYAQLPTSAVPRDDLAPERAPAAPVRAQIVRPVPSDRLAVGFPAPGLADQDRAAYEIADELLAGGPSSRLFRRLVVEEAIASSVDSQVPLTKDPGLYTLWVQMKKGHRAQDAEAIIDAELARLAEQPIAPAELEKAKRQLETQFWRELGSSEGKAEQIGQYEVCAGGFDRLLARAQEYARVSAQDVKRVVVRDLLPASRSVAIARPRQGP